MPKFSNIIITAGVIIVSVAVSLGFVSNNPENIIIGDWEEAAWTYEKANEPSMFYYDLTTVRKHEAENWIFGDDNTIIFMKNDEVVGKGKWILKGRGHILKLTHEDGHVERYDIKELNDNELILNFDIGMESRGIAKLTFKK
ncbi:lipocalin-like domain-containing protein [Litoribacter populi]|uniref:lipocalin family protein n=1 Tax=Litoribacter populi TaxID=2598460 RepID=UPI00117F45CF|nr:lipocalin family protein [Litoribacter populi]